MYRITLTGPSLINLTIKPAQDIELFVGDEFGRRVKRHYTIRHARTIG